jgi:hypothetical protein
MLTVQSYIQQLLRCQLRFSQRYPDCLPGRDAVRIRTQVPTLQAHLLTIFSVPRKNASISLFQEGSANVANLPRQFPGDSSSYV